MSHDSLNAALNPFSNCKNESEGKDITKSTIKHHCELFLRFCLTKGLFEDAKGEGVKPPEANCDL